MARRHQETVRSNHGSRFQGTITSERWCDGPTIDCGSTATHGSPMTSHQAVGLEVRPERGWRLGFLEPQKRGTRFDRRDAVAEASKGLPQLDPNGAASEDGERHGQLGWNHRLAVGPEVHGIEARALGARGTRGVSRTQAAPRGRRPDAGNRGPVCRRRTAIDGGVIAASLCVIVRLKSGAVVRADRLLVATGRRPNSEALKQPDSPKTERGWLKVNPTTLEVCPACSAQVTSQASADSRTWPTTTVKSSRDSFEASTRGPITPAVPRVTFTNPRWRLSVYRRLPRVCTWH